MEKVTMNRTYVRSQMLMAIILSLLPFLGPIQTQARPDEANIEGYVYLDANRDGQRQPEESGVEGVAVQITPLITGTTSITLTTNVEGFYLAENLAPDTYRVAAQAPPGYVCFSCRADVALGQQDRSVDLALVSDPPNTPSPTATQPPATPAPTPTPGNLVVTFYVEPATTRFPGDCATLHWWVDRATEVFLMLPSGQIGVEGAGERQVCPQATTTYRLKVNGQNGTQEIIDAQVIVPPPPTSTPRPTSRPAKKPTRKPTATPTPTPTTAPTQVPTVTPTPTMTPSPTPAPAVDPLLAGLPVRWGAIELSLDE
jgi:hypothetical protein